MAVTTEDVEEFVKLTWNGNVTLAAIDLVNGRFTGQETNPQYATFKVTDGPTDFNATAPYMQLFTVELKTWDEQGAANAGPIKLAIESAFSLRTPQAPATIPLPSGRSLRLMRSFKQPGELGEDDQTQRGQSVMVSLDKYEILCQG